jgi:HPt (histidine-containing phosphotransfer) domain-containing protein
MTPSAAPSPAPGPAPALLALLDPDSLRRLRELDPQDRHGLLRRVLDTFAESLVKHLDELAQARRDGDRALLRHVAHTLKSSSASVGALELSRICADIERRLRDEPAPAVGSLPLDDMVGQIARLLAAASRPSAPKT